MFRRYKGIYKDGDDKVNFKDHEHTIFSRSEDVSQIVHQEFIADLEDHNFVKIDIGCKAKYDDNTGNIIFKNVNEKSKYYNEEVVFQLEEGELDKILPRVVAIREGLFGSVSFKSDNITLEFKKSVTDVYTIEVIRDKNIVCTMSDRSVGLYKRFIYFLLYAMLYN